MATKKISRAALFANPFRYWRTSNGLTLQDAIEFLPNVTSTEAWRKWEHGSIPSDENLHVLAPQMGYDDATELLDAIEEWRIEYGISEAA